jgi:hypothetical protein
MHTTMMAVFVGLSDALADHKTVLNVDERDE